MATPRCTGGVSFMRTPSKRNSPSEMSSSPAIMRSRVDLPQPDGPTNTVNSPLWMARCRPLKVVGPAAPP